MTARELLDELRGELAEVERAIRGHRYLGALEARRIPDDALRDFAGEQWCIISSDRRSFAHLAARFSEPPAGDFFLRLAEGEGEALRRLVAYAGSLGVGADALCAYEPVAGCQAYTAFVSWLALNGQRADVALAFLANFAAWGDNCRRMAAALRDRCDVSFFDFFAEPAAGFEDRALAVVEQGLAAGESAARARHAARLLQAFELLYWDTLADAL